MTVILRVMVEFVFIIFCVLSQCHKHFMFHLFCLSCLLLQFANNYNQLHEKKMGIFKKKMHKVDFIGEKKM